MGGGEEGNTKKAFCNCWGVSKQTHAKSLSLYLSCPLCPFFLLSLSLSHLISADINSLFWLKFSICFLIHFSKWFFFFSLHQKSLLSSSSAARNYLISFGFWSFFLFFCFLSISCSGQVLIFFLRMSLDSVKVMEQSNKPNESEKKKKRKKQKKNNVRNSEEEEANGCWVKFRVMVCCLPSTSDVDSSSPTLSTTTRMPSFLPSLCSIWFCN